METFVLQIDLDWPRKPLFNFIADIENNPVWLCHVIDAEWVDKKEGRLASTFEELWLVRNGHINPVFHVVNYSPASKLALLLESDDYKVSVIYNFADTGESTLLKVEVRCSLDDESREFEQWLRASFEQSLVNLQKVIDQDNKQFRKVGEDITLVRSN